MRQITPEYPANCPRSFPAFTPQIQLSDKIHLKQHQFLSVSQLSGVIGLHILKAIPKCHRIKCPDV